MRHRRQRGPVARAGVWLRLWESHSLQLGVNQCTVYNSILTITYRIIMYTRQPSYIVQMYIVQLYL